MDGWVIGLIAVAGQTVVTTIVGLIVKAWWDRKNKEREELEKLREEKRVASEKTRCETVKNTVHEEICQLEQSVKVEMTNLKKDVCAETSDIKQELVLVKNGLQKDLYLDLIYWHNLYVNKLGCASLSEKKDYEMLYKTYHSLGENGVADKMFKEVMELPEKAPKGE